MSMEKKNGYCLYKCDGCGTNGKSWEEDELPDGWTKQGFLGSSHYCPRCTDKIDNNKGSADFKRTVNINNKAQSCAGCVVVGFIIIVILAVIL